MKNYLLVICIILAGCFLGYVLHTAWWIVMPLGMVCGFLIPVSVGKGFWAGLLAGFLAWLTLALMQHIPNDGLLADRVGLLFKGLKAWQVLLVTGLLGGLLAGLGLSSGASLRLWVKTPKKQKSRKRRY